MSPDAVPAFAEIAGQGGRRGATGFLAGATINALLIAAAAALSVEAIVQKEMKPAQSVLLTPIAAAQRSSAVVHAQRAPVLVAHMLPPATPNVPRATFLSRPPELTVTRQPLKIAAPVAAAEATIAVPSAPIITGAFSGTGAPHARPAQASVVSSGAFGAAAAVLPSKSSPLAAQVGSFSSSVRRGARDGGTGTLVAGVEFGSDPVKRTVSRPVLTPSTTSFDALAPQKPTVLKEAATRGQSFRSVEIVAKPKPEYTDEARNLHIEGEVWLQVLFGADGSARIQRVVRSLGHGLDETAIAAARQIRFHPARDGEKSVDQVAMIRVKFELAD